MTAEPQDRPDNPERRAVLKAGAGTAVGLPLAASAASSPSAQEAAVPDPGARLPVTLRVNGARHDLDLDPRVTLLDALRERLGLTGTKVGCNHGQCGACTVLIDGTRVNACLKLAVTAQNAEIVTIEGLADPMGELHPMQTAFVEHDAFQCGYCTPGQILSAIGCIEEGHARDADEIREYMSGNLCRCGAYPNIVRAIEAVRDGEIT